MTRHQTTSNTPKNHSLLLLSGTLIRISDLLSNSKLVIPWLLASIGVPAFFTGLLVPVRESASMLPQMMIGTWIKKHPIRKYIYLTGTLLQAFALLGMVFTAAYSTGNTAGWLVLTCMLLYSLARSFSSVTSSDILGKTIPKAQRGLLSGRAASIAGGFTLVFGTALVFGWHISTATMLGLLVLSACLMALSGTLYHFIQEPSTKNTHAHQRLRASSTQLSIIKTDATFRHFVITRGLMMSSALATPYIVLLAQQSQHSHGVVNGFHWFGLGGFIAMTGLASFISSRFWGKWADKNSKTLMRITAFFTALVCFASATISLLPASFTTPSANIPLHALLYLLCFFLLSVIHQGVRLARSTYVVDIATGNQRTTYVTVSNTLIGLLLLLVGLISAGLSHVSVHGVLVFFGGISLIATVYGAKMKAVT